jgi:predicted O-methyltransferase YrrM
VYDRVPSYVAQIAEYPDQHFDFCLVDGHYRQACILAAMPKLRPGGLLIVDDSQWMPLQAWGVRADWELALRGNSSTKETTIWKAKAITLKTKP